MEQKTADKGTILEGKILSNAEINNEKSASSDEGIKSEEGDTSDEEYLRLGPFKRSRKKYYSALYGTFGITKNGLFEILGEAGAALKKIEIKVHVNQWRI